MKLQAAKLTWDQAIYPRTDISESHVGRLADSLRVGETLAPILVDKNSNRIVDGVHRWRAHRRVLGDTCEIECNIRDFADEKELFLAAVEANSAHGLPYSGFEKTKCILVAQEMGINREQIGQVLKIPFSKIEKIVLNKSGFKKMNGSSQQIPLKRSLHKLKGTTLTIEQQRANKYAGGMSPLYYTNQMIIFLEANLMEWGGKEVTARLKDLSELLNAILASAGESTQ